MIKVVCDIETDGLLLEATKIHCIVCQDYDTGKIYKFSDTPLTDLNIKEDFIKFAETVDIWIGHNWLGFDLFILNKFLDLNIKVKQIEDTLVMSRLFTSGKFRQHSMAAWLKRLKIGIEKVKNEDWSILTPNMLDRCVKDTIGNTALYKRLLNEGRGFSNTSIRLEHNTQYLLTKQKIRGVFIDVQKAEKLFLECTNRSGVIRDLVQKEYPEIRKDIRTLWPRMVADGTTGQKRMHGQDKRTLSSNLSEQNKDGSYTLYVMQEFNLDSAPQCVERLNTAGWKPIEFNKLTAIQESKGFTQGTPKVSETNLETIPDDAPQGAKLIGEYKMLMNRKTTSKSWLENVDDNGRLHGEVSSIGAWTQRCSHFKPQTANIASVLTEKDKDGKENILYGKEGRYGFESRDCWTVDDPETRCIVGVDAKGIQVRVLAHYMDDPIYTKRILNEDPHLIHRELLGLPATAEGRVISKRWIYAWLLGAGYVKLGKFMGGTKQDAMDAEERLLENLPGLATLKANQQRDVKRGWFYGLDGRRVPAKSSHLVMSAYLQSGEAIIMKKAYIEACVKMKELDSDIVLFVHDEFQADCSLTDSEKCGKIMVDAINNTTEYFKLNCPMQGDNPKVGSSWALTH